MPLALSAPNPPAKPVARYTGEILLNTRPKTYRRVVELLAQGHSVNSISELCKVNRRTIDAISLRERTDITQRKNELTFMVSDIAHIGAARVADKIGKASTRDAIIGTGVAVDKMLALLGQGAPVQVAVVNMPSEADRDERRALHDKLDAIAARLNTPSD